MTGNGRVPSTRRRSAEKARSVAGTGSRAEARPVEGGRDRRTAYVPLKHDSERITESWARTGRKTGLESVVTASRPSVARLVGGIDPNATRGSLYKVAKRLAIKGRSSMTRRQLYEAIERTGTGTGPSQARG